MKQTIYKYSNYYIVCVCKNKIFMLVFKFFVDGSVSNRVWTKKQLSSFSQ